MIPQAREPSCEHWLLTCAQAPAGHAQAPGGSQVLGTGVATGLTTVEQMKGQAAHLVVHLTADTTLALA